MVLVDLNFYFLLRKDSRKKSYVRCVYESVDGTRLS